MYFEEKQNHDSKDHFIIAAQITDQESVQFYFTALKKSTFQVLQIHPVSTRSLQICTWQLHANQNSSSSYRTAKIHLPQRWTISQIKMYFTHTEGQHTRTLLVFPTSESFQLQRESLRGVWDEASRATGRRRKHCLSCRMWECALPGDVAAWSNTAQLWRIFWSILAWFKVSKQMSLFIRQKDQHLPSAKNQSKCLEYLHVPTLLECHNGVKFPHWASNSARGVSQSIL